MAELSTKQKILNASIRLFNSNGLANVRLQQIANEIGISPGNLAYHFRNKEAIVTAVGKGLQEEFNQILSAYRIFPNLIDFDHQLNQYFQFMQKYPFYFLDLAEINRQSPEIHIQRQQQIRKVISQIRKRLDFNQKRGLLKAEVKQGSYDSIVYSIWCQISFWVPQNLLQDNPSSSQVNRYKTNLWNLIYPHFTEKGVAEFEQLIRPILEQPSSEV